MVKKTNRILLVEDDAAFGLMLQGWLKKHGFDSAFCGTLNDARKLYTTEIFDLVLTDLRLPDGDGIDFLEWLHKQKHRVPVIVMTSYGQVQTAVQAIKLGANDFLEKPINPEQLRLKIERALLKESDTITFSTPAAHSENMQESTNTVTGNSPKTRQMYDYIRMVAPTRMSVLILGESGTGKEHVARLIHENSTRRAAPFIPVDCGSLSRDLAPSELFGHLKGSFTSAVSDKKGVFEQAQGGTVFLDEVGNLSYEVQVQLLRALQERKVRPVGAANDIAVDVRILSATNEDLKKAIAEGRFREDLYHRLNEFAIEVPPLRERKSDIPLYARFFLKEANIELNKNLIDFDPESLKALEEYEWKGNLRELKNIVRRAALFADTQYILPEHLSLPESVNISATVLPLRPEDERQRILDALNCTQGNKSQAAKLLQIDRKTLYNKMHQYNIEL